MSNLLLEFRQALRSLLHSPSFTLPIVLVLGLGLGANVAIYSILQTVLLRPLPVAQRERLTIIKTQLKGDPERWGVSHARFEELKTYPGPFTDMAESLCESSTALHLRDRKWPVAMSMVGRRWFQVLGLKPSLGRAFTSAEEATGAPVTVLSHRLWRTAFQGDPAILGRTVLTDESPAPVTVVGVGPAGFEGLELGRREDLWIPMQGAKISQGYFSKRESMAFSVAARLKPSASRSEAQVALEAASAAMASAHPDTDSGQHLVLESLEAGEQKLLRRVLPQRTLLLITSGLALLLAVVGTSGIFAARAAKREKELATRYALGADGRALAKPLLLEALLLALMSAPVALGSGLMVAQRFMLKPGQAAKDATLLPQLDGRILALGLGLSLVALLLAALVPLLNVRRMDPARTLALKTGGATLLKGGGFFVMGQVGLSLILLVASVATLNAFRSAARMGYPTAHRAFMVVDATNDPGLPERILARMRAMPEVISATRGVCAPLANFIFRFGIRGGERTEMEVFPGAVVAGDWFHTLGVRVLEGRDFTSQDGRDKVILNESLARRFFPNGSCVGRIIEMGSDSHLEVVGVVADHRMRPDTELHLPMLWLTQDWLKMNQSCVMVAGRGSARTMLRCMQEAFVLEKPGTEPEKLITLEDHVAATLHQENQNLRLLSFLGLGSLMLACFGLWAALNLQVALRGRELAIRMALGATAQQMAGRILGLGTRLLLAGIASGSILVWLLARLATGRWPGLPSIAPLDFAIGAGALLAAGLLACLIPALRAAHTQPAVTLPSE